MRQKRRQADLFYRIVQRFRGGLVIKALRLLYHLTLGLRAIKEKKTASASALAFPKSAALTPLI
jgi:hypothetical protein